MRAVQHVAGARHVGGAPGSVARRFPEDDTRPAFGDGASIVLRWTAGTVALADALARIGVPTNV